MNEVMKKIFGGLRAEEKQESVVKPAPQNTAELLDLLRRTPKTVLNSKQRTIIAAAMSFSERRVREIMLPKEDITFVYEKDFLGPLTLDKLYHSGFKHFPVLDTKKQIVGVLHTEALNSLEIKKTDRAKNYTDRKIFFLRTDYTLEQAVAAMARTESTFFVVVDRAGEIAGVLNLEMIFDFILGHIPEDDFAQDDSVIAVTKR